MGNVAQLFPYRDADNRLMFRGKIGVESKVSKFFPVRVDGRLMLRGKQADGKILWGYTYRDASGRLMGRTLAGGGGFTTPCGCTACHIVVTLSGFPDGFGSGACSTTDFTGLNGTHTLTLSTEGCHYYKVPANSPGSSPYSRCTIAQVFPDAGTQIGPYIYVHTWPSAVDITISGKGSSVSTTCSGSTSAAILGCGGLADHIGRTWYVRFPNFNVAVRLDAVL
jgi:hypothetical protein